MTERDPRSSTRRKALGALAATALTIPSALNAQAINGGRVKVLRYPFEIAETGFDPAQIRRSVFAHRHRTHLRQFLPTTIIWRARSSSGCARPSAMPEVSEDFRVWTVRIKPGIFLQDDPWGSKVKREVDRSGLATPGNESSIRAGRRLPLRALIELKILGLTELSRDVRCERTSSRSTTTRPVEGLRALDRYTVQFKLAEFLQPRFVTDPRGG